MKPVLAAIVAGLGVLLGCGGGRDGTTVTVEDGVQVVSNRGAGLWGADITGKVRFTETLSIGVAAGSEEEMLWGPVAMTVDSAGNIYVLDAVRRSVWSTGMARTSRCRILKFDGEGNRLWSKGRQGDGPGEFHDPMDVLVSPGGEILVVDETGYGQTALHYFDEDLEYRRSATIPENVWSIGVLSDGTLLVSIVVRGQPGIVAKYYSKDGEFLGPFPDSYRYGPILGEGTSAGGGVLSAGGGSIFLTTPDSYEIRQYDLQGSIRRKIRRDLVMGSPHIETTHGGRGVRVGSSDYCGPCRAHPAGFLLNQVLLVKGPQDTPTYEQRVDFFDADGVFLGSYPDAEMAGFVSIDAQGAFYCISSEPFPRVIRFAMEMNAE